MGTHRRWTTKALTVKLLVKQVKEKREPLIPLTANFSKVYVEGLNELVMDGLFIDKPEAIRAAVREMLRKELWERKNTS